MKVYNPIRCHFFFLIPSVPFLLLMTLTSFSRAGNSVCRIAYLWDLAKEALQDKHARQVHCMAGFVCVSICMAPGGLKRSTPLAADSNCSLDAHVHSCSLEVSGVGLGGCFLRQVWNREGIRPLQREGWWGNLGRQLHAGKGLPLPSQRDPDFYPGEA